MTLIALSLSACVPMTSVVKLQPKPTETASTFRNNPEIYLTVQDTRSSQTLGTLPARGTEKPVSVKAKLPLEEVIQAELVRGLTAAGFRILSAPTLESAQLVVQVKRFGYSLKRGPTWSEIEGKGEVSVDAKKGTSTRTKIYNAENGKKWAFNPPANGHEEYLNDLLSEILNALLTDQKLLSFLAGA